jgi:hypothetical protein
MNLKMLSIQFVLTVNLLRMKSRIIIAKMHIDDEQWNERWLGQPQYFDETIQHNGTTMIKTGNADLCDFFLGE